LSLDFCTDAWAFPTKQRIGHFMNIAVLGAGSIGVYVGGALLASGVNVTLIGRAAMQARLARDGLTLTDLKGRRTQLAADQIRFTQDPGALTEADLMLVTVKSADTAQAAQLIAAHGKVSALVLSLQNGVGNADTLRQTLPKHTVLAGIEPAKVVRLGPKMLPLVLSLPDVVFSQVARDMLRIDPQARSSMWEDLQAGRRTEVDYFSGAVIELAESLGIKAPLNQNIVNLVRAAEAGTQPSLSGPEMLTALRRLPAGAS
jgi:ketopantoate reductase